MSAEMPEVLATYEEKIAEKIAELLRLRDVAKKLRADLLGAGSKGATQYAALAMENAISFTNQAIGELAAAELQGESDVRGEQ